MNANERRKACRAGSGAAVLLFSLAACGGGATTGSSPVGTPIVSATSGATSAPVSMPTAAPAPEPSATATATSTGSGAQSVAMIPAFPMPLTHDGRWLTDADGRVVTFHGINVAYKDAPYTPQAQGFTQADAAMLAREGFSTVRLWIFWQAFEPTNGTWDDSSLAQVAQFIGWLQQYNITVRLNFAQILYCDAFGGLGLPDWTADTDGVPPTYMGGVAQDGSMPAYGFAFDNFWNNAPYPDSMGLEDHMARAWVHVASYFRNVPGVIAYDILNEPNGGNLDPDFETMQLTPFYKKIVAAIRTVDPVHMIDYEPQLSAALTGTGTMASAGTDPNMSLAFHYYPADNETDAAITQLSETSFQLYQSDAKNNNNDAVEMTEFGAVDDLTLIGEIIDAADEQRMGWLYWAFYSTEPEGNPATPYAEMINPQEGIVLDPSMPPTEANLKTAKLQVLDRPYPFLTAGTPIAWNFDTTTNTFTFGYSTTPVSGGAPLADQITQVVVPPRLYPSGYRAVVTGGTVVSAPGAQTLSIVPSSGATTVGLVLGPSTQSSATTSRRRR